MTSASTLKAKIYQTRFLPYGVVVITLLLSAIISFGLQRQFLAANTKRNVAPSPTIIAATASPSASTVLPTPTPSSAVLGIHIQIIKQKTTPSITPTPSPTPTEQGTMMAHTPQTKSSITTPTATPEPTTSPSPSATPIPTVASNVFLEIKTPDNDTTFAVTTIGNMNICDILQKAKDAGNIKSLTFDDSYLAAYKSRYVVEINGYKNNWTFTVNGAAPLGCSLATPKPGDTIIWKFE